MSFRIAMLAGFASLALAGAAHARDAEEPQLLPYLVVEGREMPKRTLAETMVDTGVGTLSYALIAEGAVTQARTIGGDFDGPPLFQAASISKPVSALGILRLAEQRNLDLDADINDYLVSWKVDYTGHEDAPRVTIRRLLSHRAGLTVHGFPGYEPQTSIPSTVRVLKGEGNTGPVVLFQAPGSGFSYSGGGYTVLQLLVEDLTGSSFADFIDREVLTPLGMVNSHFRDAPGGEFARARNGDGEAFDVPYHVYPEKAAAALWTTAPDLARFLIASDAIIGGEMTDMLSAEMAAQWLAIPVGEGEETYALGFGVDRGDGHEVFQHNGSNFGYKSLMYFDRVSKSGLVALVDGERGHVLNSMLARGYSRESGLDFMKQRRLVPVNLDADQWAQIEGDWAFPDGPLQGRRFRLSSTGPSDMLAAEIVTGEESRLLAVGDLEFIDTETASTLKFAQGEDNALEAIFAGRFRMTRVD
ncbi:serine hydrolase domain-containing protein [Erythrobacter aureus]|uniref:serine hydrolase domain-containing protein n=1 Tax=Erythrobacter aureus TaxID=2182384 RepID=UPI003A8F28E5